jgi:hypothetical protein
MNTPNPIAEILIAPCGMNCALCSHYLAHINNLKRSTCVGCRSEDKKCTYLFRDCAGPKKKSAKGPSFCFECDRYPCKHIDRMDKRYRIGYGMSIKENLEYIRKYGIARFRAEQYSKYRCPRCSGVISIHNGKCFRCETITRLVEKKDKKRKS